MNNNIEYVLKTNPQILRFLFLIVLVFLVQCFIAYILQSLGIYRIMKNRNLDNAFLAWIPIVNSYATGKIHDDINEKQGKKTNFRFILLGLVTFLFFMSILNNIFAGASTSSKYSVSSVGFIFSAIMFLACIIYLIFCFVCFNSIFKTCAPNKISYFIIFVIFSLFPIFPFIPGLMIYKASKHQSNALK